MRPSELPVSSREPGNLLRPKQSSNTLSLPRGPLLPPLPRPQQPAWLVPTRWKGGPSELLHSLFWAFLGLGFSCFESESAGPHSPPDAGGGEARDEQGGAHAPVRRSPSSRRTSLSSCLAGARRGSLWRALDPLNVRPGRVRERQWGHRALFQPSPNPPRARAAAPERLRTGHHLNGTKFPGKIPLDSVPGLCAMRTRPPSGERRLFPTPHVPSPHCVRVLGRTQQGFLPLEPSRRAEMGER